VAQAGWLIAGLYLTSAIAQPTMGRLADLFGPRRVYLFSLCVVMLAGIAGAIAASLGMLIADRVLVGIGTSGAIRLRCAFSARRRTVLVRSQ
jgi:MFS family permease